MNPQEQMNAEMEAVNNAINPYGFFLDGGNVYSDKYCGYNILWAKPTICYYASHNGGKVAVQLGRITYKLIGSNPKPYKIKLCDSYTMEMYYIRQYKPGDYYADENDDVFYHLDYFFRTGMAIPNLTEIKIIAYWQCQFDLALKRYWREMNPVPIQTRYTETGEPYLYQKQRGKLTGRNPRYVIAEMVSKL
jgi:hypothetical protein